MRSSSIQAPGKLMIAGEWGVLFPGSPCIAAAVNKHVTAHIESSDSYAVSAMGQKDIQFTLDNDIIVLKGEDFSFVKHALETAFAYLREDSIDPEPFHLEIISTLDDITANDEKVGFGSSAAVTVAVVGVILTAFSKTDIASEEGKLLLYKLACVAHIKAQGKVGSAFDVAASTYGGLIRYVAPDRDWLTSSLDSSPSVARLVQHDWPLLEIESLPIPEDFQLFVGYTGKGSSTSAFVKRLYALLDGTDEDAKRHVHAALDQIRTCSEKAIQALASNQQSVFLEALKSVRQSLHEFDQAAGLGIETDLLVKLSDIAEKHGAAGKLSGTGGGDCGIAVTFDSSIQDALFEAWSKRGITPLEDISIDLPRGS